MKCKSTQTFLQFIAAGSVIFWAVHVTVQTHPNTYLAWVFSYLLVKPNKRDYKNASLNVFRFIPALLALRTSSAEVEDRRHWNCTNRSRLAEVCLQMPMVLVSV